MADVWISRKRWTCKYCDVTINDDLPSRRHHESGVRHKQNVKNALQDLYRKGEQERKDAEETRKEMARIEASAAESYARDQVGGQASETTQSAPTASSSKAPTSAYAKSAPRRQLQSSSSASQEAAQPIALAGQWEQVEVAQPLPQASSSFASETSDRDRARSFRMKEKVAILDDSDDENNLSTIKIKKRPRPQDTAEDEQKALLSRPKKEETEAASLPVKNEGDTLASSAPIAPGETSQAVPELLPVKKEEGDNTPSSNKEESGGGGLFRKRRAGAGAGAKRVRAII